MVVSAIGPNHFRPTTGMPKISTILRWTLPAVAMIALGLFLTIASIETSALSQPTSPNAIFIHPHAVKGIVRYFAEWQETIYKFAKPSMYVAWAGLFNPNNFVIWR